MQNRSIRQVITNRYQLSNAMKHSKTTNSFIEDWTQTTNELEEKSGCQKCINNKTGSIITWWPIIWKCWSYVLCKTNAKNAVFWSSECTQCNKKHFWRWIFQFIVEIIDFVRLTYRRYSQKVQIRYRIVERDVKIKTYKNKLDLRHWTLLFSEYSFFKRKNLTKMVLSSEYSIWLDSMASLSLFRLPTTLSFKVNYGFNRCCAKIRNS